MGVWEPNWNRPFYTTGKNIETGEVLPVQVYYGRGEWPSHREWYVPGTLDVNA